MKKILILSWLILCFATTAYAQDKIEAPVWNVGDKWNFTGGSTMEVVAADKDSYTVKFSDSESLTIFDKSTLNRKYILEREKRKEYKGGRKRLLNFPLILGKTWKDKYSSRATRSTIGDQENMYVETFKVLGWEEVKVGAGTFKAIKIEYSQEGFSKLGDIWKGMAWYWYSPEAKYFVKVEYEKNPVWTGIYGWELTSFDLKN